MLSEQLILGDYHSDMKIIKKINKKIIFFFKKCLY